MFPTDRDPLTPEDGGLLERIQVYQAVVRRWSRVLGSANATMVLMHLVDQTCGWGRACVDTTAKRIAEGGEAGTKAEWIVGPTCLSVATVERCLAQLRENNLIRTEKVHHPGTRSILGLRIWLNTPVILEPVNMAAPDFRTPKRLKTMPPHSEGTLPSHRGDPSLTVMAPFPHSEGPNKDTYTSNLTGNFTGRASGPPDLGLFNEGAEEEEDKAVAAPAAPVSVREAVASQQAKSTARRVSELQAARDRIRAALPWAKDRVGRVRAEDLWTVWHASYIEGLPYDDAPADWSKADRGTAMQLFARWTVKRDGEKPNGEFDEFLTWIVAEWRSVMSDKFGWMKSPSAPQVPNIRFVSRFFPEFEEGWVVRGRKKVLTRLDLSEFDELRAKGFSEDRALEEIAKRKMAKHKRAAPVVSPRPLPVARPRTRPLQPVATESGLTPDMAQPTNVVRQQIAKKDPAAWERELWGPKSDEGE